MRAGKGIYGNHNIRVIASNIAITEGKDRLVSEAEGKGRERDREVFWVS